MNRLEEQLDKRFLIEFVRHALAEDIGRGDVTTNSVVRQDAVATGSFVVEADGILAGLPVALEVFKQLDDRFALISAVKEGQAIKKGQTVAQIRGSARALLTGERTALNILQRLSGIATLTSQYVKAIEGTDAVVVDTRKTTPGLRMLEKYAVKVGGGQNHRFGLDDGVMIKDNHIALAGGIKEAVRRVRQQVSHTLKIEVECDTIDQVRQALEAKADIILLDNMPPDKLKEAVSIAKDKAVLEASGGINLDTIRAAAETGVDLISVGALTHSAPILSMKFETVLNDLTPRDIV